MREITSFDDVIDSRDVIERIEELDAARMDDDTEWTDDDRRELDSLNALARQGENVDDWEHGACLIRYSYFVDYCRELVEDIGGVPEGMADYIVIDWAATARILQVDYPDVEFNGITYFVR